MAVLSSMSSHSLPTLGICTTWSITDSDENPASSAARAMVPRRVAVSAGAPGHVNRPTCNPKRNGMGSSSWRRAAAGVSWSGRGTISTGPSETRWTASNSSPRSSTVAASARSWLVTTADGTASGRDRLRARVSRSGVSTTTAWHGTPAALASARYLARTLASRAVESMTVSSPLARRLATIRSRTSRASDVARRSWRWRPTVPRRSSDDTTAAGSKHEAAHVDLPDPAVPTSTTRHGSGSRMAIGQHSRTPRS